MRLIFGFVFNLMLLNGCLSGNTNRKSSETRALDEDFQYAIFESSDLIELLHMAKDPRVSEFVRKHIFPVKYHNYMINIFTNTDEDYQEGKVDELEKR